MKEHFVSLRNAVERFFYVNVFKPIFFLFDPEDVHNLMTSVGVFLGNYKLTRLATSFLFSYSNPALEQKILGIKFPNPIGLAAGFDKEAILADILPAVGFGFAEVGSITGEPCKGNDRPRLWRLPKSEALVIYYGLKNAGCEVISKRLGNKKFEIPIGTSVAKTNNSKTCDLEAGVADYVKAYRSFVNIGDYSTVNISCPNAFGGEPYTDPVKLEKLLSEIDKIKTKKPVFLKISPDLSESQLVDIIKVCDGHEVDGFICSNLTKKRDNPKIKDEEVPEKGGISGKVVEELADEQIRFVYKNTKGKYKIIGCGGIFNADDAYKKIRAGASLLQLITGMIFEGPQSVGDINLGLVRLLKRDGFKNISEAVGVDNPC
jgi:dihydroorotate dehydrogenase